MKTPEEFDAFLRDDIAPKLREVEREREAVQARRDAVRVAGVWKIAGAAAGLLLTIWIGGLGPLAVGAGLPWIVEMIRRSRVPDTAAPLVRSAILEPIITFWDPSFRYEPHRSISREEFEASRLYAGEVFNTYAGEDFVTGRHGETAFRFCEIHAKHVTRRKKRTETRTVFDGLFFVADFNKSFRGQTLVLPDTAERTLGSFGRAFQSLASRGAGMQLVELECPEFERAFVVRTTDPVEARYLLSPSLMQRIRAFHDNTGSKLRIGFLRGRVYVALPMEGDLFSTHGAPGVPAAFAGLARSTAPLTLDDVRRWSGELLFAIGIVDELDLNTRIWSKAPAA
jgi:hypothetical protein